MPFRRVHQITYARAEKKKKNSRNRVLCTYYVSWEEIVGLIAVGIPDGCKNSISFNWVAGQAGFRCALGGWL